MLEISISRFGRDPCASKRWTVSLYFGGSRFGLETHTNKFGLETHTNKLCVVVCLFLVIYGYLIVKISCSVFSVLFLFIVFRGKPNNDTRESDDEHKIQNQSFAPAYRGPEGQLQHTTKRHPAPHLRGKLTTWGDRQHVLCL